MNRRDFLHNSLGAVAAGTLLPSLTPAGRALPRSPRVATLDKIGVQLYTLRSEMEKNVAATLERVGKIGYNEVEFAGYFGQRPAQIAALLKAAGLTAPSAHIDLATIRTNWQKMLDDASAIGHRYLVCSWIEEKERSPESLKKIAAEFNVAAMAARKHGITFAYHNHDFEFVKGPDGVLLYDALLANTDASLVKMEMDLYWIHHGKQDPQTYFAKYPGRFELVHVKDMKTGGAMADVGAGTLPWARLFAQHGQAGIRHYFVEHDEPADAFASVTASLKYLRALTF